MKNTAVLLAAILLARAAATADIIRLDDGGAIRGRVISVTDHRVEFDPEDDRSFDVIDRIRVTKIEYENGMVLDLSRSPDIPAEEAKGKGWRPAPFMDARVRIAGFFACGTPREGIFNGERRLFNLYRADLIRAYVRPRDYRLNNLFVAGGGEIDYLPPAIRLAPRGRFGLRGIRFGIRARYGFEYADSAVVDEGRYFITVEGYELFRGRLMGYHYGAAGPVINIVLGPRNDGFNLLINMCAMGGPVFGGTVRAAAGIRSARMLACEMAGLFGPPFLPPAVAVITRLFHRSGFRGYTVRFGLGPHIAMNRNIPINFGINVIYARTGIVLGTPLPVYGDFSRRRAHHEVGAEVAAGLHL